MRRNAESLLVLVGAAGPYKWTEPLPVADVIRAAVSEVEEYRRVSLRRVDDVYVTGAVAAGLAHMLAELVENGLTFSPPDADVEIQGRRLGDRYLIAVTDQGVGMSGADLATANARLRDAGDFVSAPARYLGHYVVGRLAAELGIEVQLAPSPVTGITARVLLPSYALTGLPQPQRPSIEAAAGVGRGAGAGAIAEPMPVKVELASADDRTSHGLRKRQPRQRTAEPMPASRGGALVEDSPQDVRNRLTALRAGVQRGSSNDDR
jgi:anti-sigma regulatory factor (Ser/Thr protein kinase)